jgi:nicotinate-nucleotide adenylyltransferase
MNEKKRHLISRLGIFGGTFNPPHLGHLIVAEEICHQFALDRIVFVPSARPPHKTHAPVIDSAHRYRMTQLAIRRPGTSYTVDTVKSFRNTYGPDVDIYFIMGGDSIFEIDTWKDPAEIVRHCTIIVTTRPGFDLSNVEDRLKTQVRLADVTEIGISSTAIRRRVREGKSITYLVPKAVENYILENNLYRGEPAEEREVPPGL